MLSLKDFKEFEMNDGHLNLLFGGDAATKYKGSDGSSGDDMWCDDNGDGVVSDGDTCELDDGRVVTRRNGTWS